MEKILKIANSFNVESEIINAQKYGCGHINDTYKVSSASKSYILQRVNHLVFKDVKGLMQNIVGVTTHIKKAMEEANLDTTDALTVIYSKEGKSYVEYEGNFYRLYNFVLGGVSIETAPTKEQFMASAKGYGRFQKLLDGYPAETIIDSIPNFHNTVKRFENFENAIKEDKSGRLCQAMEEVDWFFRRKKYCSAVLDLIQNGEIPLRVTHNDTKLNNVLINVETLEPVTVIDLDTVMAGSLLYDFGDSIRSGANTGAEDEKDLSKVDFSIELFEAYAKAFLGEVGERLTEGEKENLAFGAILMTFECGMRFLTDFIDGDTYFKTKYADHNLVRCHTQMKLVERMEERFEEMDAIVQKYLK